MSLSQHIKTQAPGYNVRSLAARLGYSEYGLRKMWHKHPGRVELWLKGLRYELQKDTNKG